MKIQEITAIKPTKPETPEQARISSLKQGVERARAALDSERKRQRVNKATQRLRLATQH